MKEYARREVKIRDTTYGKALLPYKSQIYLQYNRSNLSHSLSKLGSALAGEVLQRRLNLQAYYQLEQGLSIG